MSVSDNGALVIEDDGSWEAHPHGSHGGTAGVFATREEAITCAEWQVACATCCQDDSE